MQSVRRRLHGAFCAAAVPVFLAIPLHGAQAQVEDLSWRSSLELGASIGGTWLEGKPGPNVASAPGIIFGLAIQRGVSPFVAGGFGMRVATSSVSLEEANEKWSAGRLLEVGLMANTLLLSRRRATYRTSIDLGAGVTIVGGVREVVPFRDISAMAPTGEIGFSVRRGIPDADASRQDLAFFVKYNAMLLRVTARYPTAETGTVGRIFTGFRVTR